MALNPSTVRPLPCAKRSLLRKSPSNRRVTLIGPSADGHFGRYRALPGVSQISGSGTGAPSRTPSSQRSGGQDDGPAGLEGKMGDALDHLVVSSAVGEPAAQTACLLFPQKENKYD